MKVVLVGINAKFIHSNLAIRYLKAFTGNLEYECILKEFSINDRKERILEEIMEENPDFVGFSCYIWNVDFSIEVARLIKLVAPQVRICYGGPEVSYEPIKFLKKSCGNYVIYGEGEKTYSELIQEEIKFRKCKLNEHMLKLQNIKGLCFRDNDGSIVMNEARPEVDMNELVFPYEKCDDLKNKIIYYETSRGCPFKCSYCLSSTTGGVRFLNMERVKRELNFLIEKGFKLIKFVDRTFNCNSKFAVELWKFIIDKDTDATFHFEISADILTNEEIKILNSAPKGRIQLEVGVQTTNSEVLSNISRNVEFSCIREKVRKVAEPNNISQHLDLIAGLPGENFESFRKSFNDVYSISPSVIQLGFLKVLKGSSMKKNADRWGIVYSPYPPYEVLKTDSIMYGELRILKRVDKMVDKYYNSGKFSHIISYFVNKFNTPFDFYKELGGFFYDSGYFKKSLSASKYYEVFLEFNQKFMRQDSYLLREIIKYDYLKFNKKRWLPEFLFQNKVKSEEKFIRDKIKSGEIDINEDYHIEKFFIDVDKLREENTAVKKEEYVIFYGESIKTVVLDGKGDERVYN